VGVQGDDVDRLAVAPHRERLLPDEAERRAVELGPGEQVGARLDRLRREQRGADDALLGGGVMRRLLRGSLAQRVGFGGHG
jgi:hypothetical protein